MSPTDRREAASGLVPGDPAGSRYFADVKTLRAELDRQAPALLAESPERAGKWAVLTRGAARPVLLESAAKAHALASAQDQPYAYTQLQPSAIVQATVMPAAFAPHVTEA